MELILASTSPYRRELLARLRLPFRCVAPGVDEASIAAEGLGPVALAERLARAKAEAVAASEPDAVVIGSDQLVAFEGRVLGKPGTAERAVEQLLAMAGREHLLITAVAVADRLRDRGRDRRRPAHAPRPWRVTRPSVTSRPTARSTAPAATRSSRSGSPCSTGSRRRTRRRSSACRC